MLNFPYKLDIQHKHNIILVSLTLQGGPFFLLVRLIWGPDNILHTY